MFFIFPLIIYFSEVYVSPAFWAISIASAIVLTSLVFVDELTDEASFELGAPAELFSPMFSLVAGWFELTPTELALLFPHPTSNIESNIDADKILTVCFFISLTPNSKHIYYRTFALYSKE